MLVKFTLSVTFHKPSTWTQTRDGLGYRIAGSRGVILSSGFQTHQIIGGVAVEHCTLCPLDKGLWVEGRAGGRLEIQLPLCD